MSLGLLVTGVTYRHPGLLAKIVTTLDILSEGRASLGLGAAWYEREHQALGVPLPTGQRALRAARGGAADLPADVERRRRARIRASTTSWPRRSASQQPIQQPHPPILVGGCGEQKTLRLVAQYADACNLFAIGADEVKHKLDVLREHCERSGRDYDAIQKTLQGGGDPIGDPDRLPRRHGGVRQARHRPGRGQPPGSRSGRVS